MPPTKPKRKPRKKPETVTYRFNPSQVTTMKGTVTVIQKDDGRVFIDFQVEKVIPREDEDE